jgi:hypothetical protein
MIFPAIHPYTRAVPQPCGDFISPESSTSDGQHNLVVPAPVQATYKVIVPLQKNGFASAHQIVRVLTGIQRESRLSCGVNVAESTSDKFAS